MPEAVVEAADKESAAEWKKWEVKTRLISLDLLS